MWEMVGETRSNDYDHLDALCVVLGVVFKWTWNIFMEAT